MKIAYYIAYPQRMAGANRSLFELIVNLPESVQPSVIVAGEGSVADAYRDAGIRTEIVPVKGTLAIYGKQALRKPVVRKLWAVITELSPYIGQLRKRLRQMQVDLVHVNDPRGALLAAPAAKMAGVPVVAHLRGEFPFGPIARMLFERAASHIITVSEGARKTLSKRGQNLSTTVYNGIRRIPPAQERVPWLNSMRQRGRVIVACFASVVPFKGHHHLIRAVAELNRRGLRDRVAVICVGDIVAEYKEYYNWLRQVQQECDVDNLTFIGWQDNPFKFYGAADLTVLPSVSREKLTFNGHEINIAGNEGFPRTHLEAMQFGLPIVGTHIAGVPEQIEDGVTGILVPPSQPVDLADALEVLIRDQSLRREMGLRGYSRVQELFSTQAYVAGVCDVYTRVLSGRVS